MTLFERTVIKILYYILKLVLEIARVDYYGYGIKSMDEATKEAEICISDVEQLF